MNRLPKGAVGLLIVSLLQACSSTPTYQENSVGYEGDSAFRTYSARQFYKTTTVFGSSINHDGTAVLISSDKSGLFNAYKVPVDGSYPTKLTSSRLGSVYVKDWFPKDDRFIYQADQGGNELDHVYVRELDGRIIDLTPGENHKAEYLGWHVGDNFFYIATNERDPKYFDIFAYDARDYSRTMIYKNVQDYSIDGISPNGKWLVLSKENTNADSDLFLIDLEEPIPSPRLITQHVGNVAHSTYCFTRDSKKLIYATNEFGEFNQAWSYDIESETRQLNYKTDWDVSFTYFSRDGRYQVIGVNAEAQTKLFIVDRQTDEKMKLPNLPEGDLRGVRFSRDSSTMVFYISSDTSPSNLYAYSLAAGTLKRLTNSGNPAIKEENLVTGEVVRFKSFDGLLIPGILYKPKQAEIKRVPALIMIHGGPGGQSRKGYHAQVQHLVNNGYAIFRINNRGSYGYGKTFLHLDDRKHGDVDLKDVIYNKKYLQSLPWIDPDRIGVMGASYGGFLTMAAMAFTDEFDVGINIFGVTNWVRTLENIPPYWEAIRKALYDELGDPRRDRKRLQSISPVHFGHQVKKPVLVVQGTNDPRVLKIESDEMVDAIRRGGTHVDYLVFDDEGHGFSKKKNRISASNKYLKFVEEHLK